MSAPNLFNLHEARHHWRKHRKLRRQHKTLITIWLILFLITGGVFSYSFTQVRAKSVNLSLAISRAYICGDGIIDTGEECDDGNLVNSDGCSSECKNETTSNPTPANPITGGNGPYLPIIWPLPQIKPPSEKEKAPSTPTTIKMTVQIMTTADSSAKSLGDFNEQSAPTSIIIIPTAKPVFRGHLNQPQALLRLVLRSDIVTTLIQADADGNWQWQPVQPLADGPHELFITVYSPDGAAILMEEFSLKFLIDSTASGQYLKPVEKIINKLQEDQQKGQQLMEKELNFPQPITYHSLGDYLPVDLRVSANKSYQPGEDLTVRLILNQYRSDANPNKSFTYTLRDRYGSIVWQQTETHQIQAQTNIVTNLKPTEKLAPGVYQLEVSLPIDQTTALASTLFQIATPISPLYQTLEINWLMVTQTAAALLLVFLLAIFFEYRYLRDLGRFEHPITAEDLKSIGYLT